MLLHVKTIYFSSFNHFIGLHGLLPVQHHDILQLNSFFASFCLGSSTLVLRGGQGCSQVPLPVYRIPHEVHHHWQERIVEEFKHKVLDIDNPLLSVSLEVLTGRLNEPVDLVLLGVDQVLYQVVVDVL